MIYVLSGLHGAGKSSVVAFANELGLAILNKRERFREIHEKLGLAGDWVAWYLRQYEQGEAAWLIEKTIEGRTDSDLVYDSVHNPLELEVLEGLAEVCLIRIDAHEHIRADRHGMSIDELRAIDRKRVGHQLDRAGHNFTDDAEFILLNNGTVHSLQRAFLDIVLLSGGLDLKEAP